MRTRLKEDLKRIPTNVTLRSDLVKEAKRLGINLSHTFEDHLAQVLSAYRSEQWKKENMKGIQDYARYVGEHGVWNQKLRDW